MQRLMIISSLIALMLTTTLFAQRNEGHGEWGRMGGRIEQLEKIKIIEELNMDEETTLKFFSRRNEHRENQRALIEKRDLVYKDLSKIVNSEDEIITEDGIGVVTEDGARLITEDATRLKTKVDEVFNIENEMLIKRKEFLYSLNDFLTEKEIAKLILFEFNFRNEVRHQFMKQGQRRMRQN